MVGPGEHFWVGRTGKGQKSKLPHKIIKKKKNEFFNSFIQNIWFKFFLLVMKTTQMLILKIRNLIGNSDDHVPARHQPVVSRAVNVKGKIYVNAAQDV